MATLPTYFRDFLAEIRPTDNQMKGMKTGHETLRERLEKDEALKSILVSTFLQGSYRRATAIRAAEGKRSDVDVVVVTNLNRADYPDPQDAMEGFRAFVKKHYGGKYHFQGRSIGIELSYVDLDLVITSAPSEVAQMALCWEAVRSLDTPEDVDDWRLNSFWIGSSRRSELGAQSRLFKAAAEEQWKSEPLWIPDREAGTWEETNPLAQIAWTFDKNKETGGHYVNVVKALKWWRRTQHPEPKHPKSYPLEHLIGECCPDEIDSVALGITLTLEEIRDRYATAAALERTPHVSDPERTCGQNVLERVSGEDFATFHEQVSEAADLARRAYEEESTTESAGLWRQLLGDKFPPPRSGSGKDGGSGGLAALSGGFSEREAPSVPPRGEFG